MFKPRWTWWSQKIEKSARVVATVVVIVHVVVVVVAAAARLWYNCVLHIHVSAQTHTYTPVWVYQYTYARIFCNIYIYILTCLYMYTVIRVRVRAYVYLRILRHVSAWLCRSTCTQLVNMFEHGATKRFKCVAYVCQNRFKKQTNAARQRAPTSLNITTTTTTTATTKTHQQHYPTHCCQHNATLQHPRRLRLLRRST